MADCGHGDARDVDDDDDRGVLDLRSQLRQFDIPLVPEESICREFVGSSAVLRGPAGSPWMVLASAWEFETGHGQELRAVCTTTFEADTESAPSSQAMELRCRFETTADRESAPIVEPGTPSQTN